MPVQNEEISKFKTYVKLLNKRIKEMGGEIGKLKEENKFMKKRLDHVESTLFMINTTLLNGNIMNKQQPIASMNPMMPQQFGMRGQFVNNANQQMMLNNQNQIMMNQNNMAMMGGYPNQGVQPVPSQPKPVDDQNPGVGNQSKPFEKKLNHQVQRAQVSQGSAMQNQFINPSQALESGMDFDPKNRMAQKLISEVNPPIPVKNETSPNKQAFMSLEEKIRNENPTGNAQSQLNIEIINELSSPELANNEERFVFLWKLFLQSEIWLESVVLLNESITKLLMQKIIDLEVNAQLSNDMDLLSLVFKWLFELISLPQFESELLVFLDSELFIQENRYFDDSQLDMSEICVNSTDITHIIREKQYSLGFKVWKTTIFTISAYENEEIMEHCHKIVSYMRQKSMGSAIIDQMSGITEEPQKYNGKSFYFFIIPQIFQFICFIVLIIFF